MFEILEVSESPDGVPVFHKKSLEVPLSLSHADAEELLDALASLVEWRVGCSSQTPCSQPEGAWKTAESLLDRYRPPLKLWDVWAMPSPPKRR